MKSFLTVTIVSAALVLCACNADRPEKADETKTGTVYNENTAVRDAREATSDAAHKIIDATVSAANRIKALGSANEENKDNAENAGDKVDNTESNNGTDGEHKPSTQ